MNNWPLLQVDCWTGKFKVPLWADSPDAETTAFCAKKWSNRNTCAPKFFQLLKASRYSWSQRECVEKALWPGLEEGIHPSCLGTEILVVEWCLQRPYVRVQDQSGKSIPFPVGQALNVICSYALLVKFRPPCDTWTFMLKNSWPGVPLCVNMGLGWHVVGTFTGTLLACCWSLHP